MKMTMKKAAILISIALCASCAAPLHMNIGTNGDNIYEAVWNGKTLKAVNSLPARQVTYFANGADGVFYSVGKEKDGAALSTFKNGRKLAMMKQSPKTSCFIITTPHPYIFTAEYGAATISAFNVKDGVVTGLAQNMHFEGCGPHKNQKTAHMHQIRMVPEDMCKAAGIEGEWYFATDLGSDRIRCFRYLAAAADSVLQYVPSLDIMFKPGSGPRHMEFNHKFGLLYCVTELSDEVVTFKLGNAGGAPTLTQNSCIHADEAYASGGADIHLSPGGRFLYSSHRLKSDGIAIFKVSEADGSLKRIGFQRTESHPRNFVLSPDGKNLFVACRDGKCVQVFDIDKESGMLSERTKARLVLENAPPMCVILK